MTMNKIAKHVFMSLLLATSLPICSPFTAIPLSQSSIQSHQESSKRNWPIASKNLKVNVKITKPTKLYSSYDNQKTKPLENNGTTKSLMNTEKAMCILKEAEISKSSFQKSSTEELKSKLEEKIPQLTNELNDIEFQLLVQDMSSLLNDLEAMERGEVLTENEDAFYKLITSTISDPTMKVVSSEIGIKEWVEREVKKDIIPDSSSIPIDTLIQRTMDTIEDIVVHLRRIPFEKGNQVLTPEQEATRKTVVVLGSGWGAHALIKVADCFKLRLIVVSPSNHFVFTPMLASSAVGTVEYRSMTEAVRASNPMIDEYLEGKATAVDVKNKKITVQLNSLLEDFREGEPPILEVPYDHLIVSVGCRVDDKGVPGAEKALRLKTCDDAMRLRRAIGESFEYASRPDAANDKEEQRRRATFLIVGGGPTGVELAGEILDLTDDITRPHKGTYPELRDSVRVILVHSGPDLLPPFNDRLRAEALKSLEKKGAQVILNTRVEEVGDGFAKLSKKLIDEETGEVVGRDVFEIPTGLTVWCAGTKPNDFVAELLKQLPEEARNIDGRVKVDKWLRPPMPSDDLLGSVLVLGDAAAFPEGDEQIARNKMLPQNAQVAGQQGAYAARMLDRGYNLTTTPPMLSSETGVFNDPAMKHWLEVRGLETSPGFVFLNLGILAYLGGGEALSQVQLGDFPLFSYFGSVAFVLWRSVYLVKQVATRNRVLVTFDWIKSAVFGRDTTRY